MTATQPGVAAQPAGTTELISGAPGEPDGPVAPARSGAPGGRHGLPPVSLGHIPGLDGMRAVGLVVVLAYDHGVAAARGGMFTVSMFFTLSGYLITALALVEWSEHGRLSFRRFWERRARRLLPAATATVGLVVALQHLFEVGSSARFRGDVLASLGYVANWRYALSEGGDYAAMFETRSPVQPFWSLAVEEQFYLVFPLLFVGLMTLARARWGVVAAVFAAGGVASYGAAWQVAASQGNSGLAYYATYTRAGEILVGVVLAFLLLAAPVRRFLASPPGVWAARLGGLVGLAGFAWLWNGYGLSDPFAFRGGTAVNALFTSLVILACVNRAPGVAARVLGTWPLRELGKVAYGVYLVHWPVFLLLDPGRFSWLRLGFWPLLGVRAVVSVAVAVISYHLLESPFRWRLRMPRPRLVAALGLPALVVAALLLVVPVHPSPLVALRSEDSDPFDPDVVTPHAGAAPAADVLLVGDSVSWTMWPGFATWNAEHPDQQVQVDALVSMGCSLGGPGRTLHFDRVQDQTVSCHWIRERITELVRPGAYDVVVLQLGHKDLGARRLQGEWRSFGDPVYDEWFRGEVRAVGDILEATGVPVLWMETSYTRVVPLEARGTHTWEDFAANDPARVDRQNRIVREELAGRPGIRLVPVDELLQQAPGGRHGTAWRHDGVHYTRDGSAALAAWLMPRLLALVPGSDTGSAAAVPPGAGPAPRRLAGGPDIARS